MVSAPASASSWPAWSKSPGLPRTPHSTTRSSATVPRPLSQRPHAPARLMQPRKPVVLVCGVSKSAWASSQRMRAFGAVRATAGSVARPSAQSGASVTHGVPAPTAAESSAAGAHQDAARGLQVLGPRRVTERLAAAFDPRGLRWRQRLRERAHPAQVARRLLGDARLDGDEPHAGSISPGPAPRSGPRRAPRGRWPCPWPRPGPGTAGPWPTASRAGSSARRAPADARSSARSQVGK